MRALFRDQNGNTLRVDGTPGDKAAHVEVEASRVEGLAIGLSDDAETIIVTLTLEEV